MFFDQVPKQVGLDGTEVDGHERMRDDREAALVVDGRHGVVERHPPLDGAVQEPGHHVGPRRPPGGDLLCRDHLQARGVATLLGFLDRPHRVVVGDGDQVESGLDGGLDQLCRGDHAVGGEGVTVRVGDHLLDCPLDGWKGLGGGGGGGVWVAVGLRGDGGGGGGGGGGWGGGVVGLVGGVVRRWRGVGCGAVFGFCQASYGG